MVVFCVDVGVGAGVVVCGGSTVVPETCCVVGAGGGAGVVCTGGRIITGSGAAFVLGLGVDFRAGTLARAHAGRSGVSVIGWGTAAITAGPSVCAVAWATGAVW